MQSGHPHGLTAPIFLPTNRVKLLVQNHTKRARFLAKMKVAIRTLHPFKAVRDNASAAINVRPKMEEMMPGLPEWLTDERNRRQFIRLDWVSQKTTKDESLEIVALISFVNLNAPYCHYYTSSSSRNLSILILEYPSRCNPAETRTCYNKKKFLRPKKVPM